jgi:hypothetical protein
MVLGHRFQGLVAGAFAACTLFCGLAGGRAAAVDVREDVRQGRTVLVMANGFLLAVVDPGDGGAISFLPAGGAAGGWRPAAVLSRDTVRDRICTYQVAYQSASESAGVLGLAWSDSAGLRIEKTIALLAEQQVVRVDYRVENSLPRAEAVQIGFRFDQRDGAPCTLHVSHESGFEQYAGSSLPEGTAESVDDVRWLSATQPSAEGAAVVAGVGALSKLRISAPPNGKALEMAGTTIVVPPGRALRAHLALAPLHGLTPPTGVTEQIAYSVGMERAGRTARANLTVLPLASLGSGDLTLRLLSRPAGTTKELAVGPRQMLCGRAEAFSFYWEPAAAGSYRVELVVPGVRDPLALGTCTLTENGVDFSPYVRLPPERVTLEDLTLAFMEASEVGSAKSAPFTTPEGRPLTGLLVDVGVGEHETALFGVAGLDAAAGQLRASRLVTPRGVRALPPASLRVQPVPLPDTSGAAASVEGVAPAGVRLVALRLTAPDVEAGVYRGQVEAKVGLRTAALPLTVRIWPVLRPLPGLVRFYVSDPLCGPLVQGVAQPSAGSLQECDVENIAIGAHDLLRGPWVSVRSATGGQMPLDQWLRDRAPQDELARLPSLDFSAANERLQRLLLAGLGDVVVVGRVSVAAISVPDVAVQDEAALAQWFWRGFADHLRDMGFGRLYFLESAPVESSALGEDWFAAAAVLRTAGWSVCGPYGQSVFGGPPAERAALVGRLSALGELALVDAALAGSVSEIRALLPPGAGVGVWTAGLPAGLSAAEARTYAHELADGGADVIVFGSAASAGAQGQPASEGAAGESLAGLAWDGFRDGLDEVNYVRMLSASEAGAAQAAGVAAPAAAVARLTKPQVLERLSAFGETSGAELKGLWWNELMLTQASRPHAVMGTAPEFPEQVAQAEALNQMIQAKGGASLPVVNLSELDSTPKPKTVILFGSPDTNPLIRRLAAARKDLSWRLEANGCMFARFVEGDTTYLALLTANQADWGRPVVLFSAMLRRDGGWVRQ